MSTQLAGSVDSLTTAAGDWRKELPVLRAAGVSLRELRPSDAASLKALLAADDVTRFISPPPSTVEGFERFIAWTLQEQTCGRYICFGIVPDGCEDAVGIIGRDNWFDPCANVEDESLLLL